MAFRILTTKSFEQALKRHPHPHIVYQKIQLLAENPYHPSLKGHRLKQIKDKNVWDAYISDSERILYEHKGEILHLWDLGSHSVVDKAHVHIYSQHKLTKPFNILQRNFDAPVTPLLDEKHENEKYEGDRDNDYFATSSPLFPSLDLSEQTLVIDETQNEEIEEEIQYKPINHFQFFEDAHLRILGVPANLIQDVKHALSTDDALLGLTDLPEETRTRLLETYTSQDLQISMFDESLLVHHTDLDQLNSFCGGKIKQLMLNLETEQQKYVDMDYPPAIIYGTAGSGKTAVALYRAIRLAQEGQDVLLLTFSSRLSQETKKLIISILGYIPNNLEVTTFHAAMLTLLQKVGVDVQVEEEKENGKQSIYSELIGEAILDIQKDYPTVAFLKDKTSSQVKRFVQEEIRYMIKGSDRTTWEKYKTEIRKGRKRFDPKEREAMWRIYKAYQYRLDYSEFDDWVDISTLVIHNIQNYHDFRHYDAIIVDETQDLTLVDIQAVKQVALALSSINGKACNLLLLLDPLQKVYSQGSSDSIVGCV